MAITDLLIRDSYYTYIDYIGIKTHFKSDSYHWKWQTENKKIKFETYLKRKDCKLFKQLADKYKTRDNWRQVMISSFLCNKDTYVYDLINLPDDIKDFHVEREENVKNLSSIFNIEIERIGKYLDRKNLPLDKYLNPVVESPLILTTAGQVNISLETISILDKVFSFTSVATESPIWEKRRQQIKKYSELLELPKPLILEKVEFLYNNFMEMKV